MCEQFPVASESSPVASEAERPPALPKFFDVVFVCSGKRKVDAIKLLRLQSGYSGLGLMEAKELIESAPFTILANVPKPEAISVQESFTKAGCKVEIR